MDESSINVFSCAGCFFYSWFCKGIDMRCLICGKEAGAELTIKRMWTGATATIGLCYKHPKDVEKLLDRMGIK